MASAFINGLGMEFVIVPGGTFWMGGQDGICGGSQVTIDRRLLDDLRQVGVNNQIIATMHSNYLRDVLPTTHVVTLGDIGDSKRKGG